MTTRRISKTSRNLLALAAVSAALMGAGLARADGPSCLLGGGAPKAESSRSGGYPQEVNQQMARIEAALRAGQISPFEAGQLMRQQWEIAQFQRGFLNAGGANAGAVAKPTANAGCALGGDLGAKLGPLMGDMAKNGMETASTVMRALRRETERLLQDPAPLDGPAL
jgi:hypothetical protein